MSSALQEPFKSLGFIRWDFGDVNESGGETRIREVLTQVFQDAKYIIDSIPGEPTPSAQQSGRPRSSTDPSRQSLRSKNLQPSEHAKKLSKEWKEIKVGPKENPLGLSVYKLAAKDGKGAWFARRSVHEGQSFDKWKLAMQREFPETMKVKGKPGSGKIRGIGADRRVEHVALDGCGKAEVYHLSAQFPGPTTPRDFVTMLLTTDCALDTSGSDDDKSERYFYVVSKPCDHPETPETPAFIRGTYESVEVIREIRVRTQNDPLRKIQSSIDLPTDEANAIARSTVNHLAHESPIRAAHSPTLNGVPEGDTAVSTGTAVGNGEPQPRPPPISTHEDYETHIEWIMVTRSDPGGSVPRFMVEKGTPAGIAGDADKFLKWVESKTMQDLLEPDVETVPAKTGSPITQETTDRRTISEPGPTPGSGTPTLKVTRPPNTNGPVREVPSAVPGLFGIITGAYGAATSMLPNPFGSPLGDTSPEAASSMDTDDEDDRSSIRTFHSFVTGQENLDDDDDDAPQDTLERINTNGKHSIQSSTESAATRSQNTLSQHEKELRKLEERQRKTEERLQRAQARALAKRGHEGGPHGDEDALAKLREKYDRELAKHEEKHERQRRKLEAKRQNEERKAAERRQKQAEREERRSLAAELDKARAERDVARKQIEVLKEQVGELQAQNTMLVARLGREGIKLEGDLVSPGAGGLASDPRRRSSPVASNGGGGGGGRISRASTILGTPTQQHPPSPFLGPPATDRPRGRGVHAQAHTQAERVS